MASELILDDKDWVVFPADEQVTILFIFVLLQIQSWTFTSSVNLI
jgi:hypothetical protein